MSELESLPYEIHPGPDLDAQHRFVEVLARAARFFLPRLAACRDKPEPDQNDLSFGVTNLVDVERFCPGVLKGNYAESLMDHSLVAGQELALAVAQCLQWPQKFNLPDPRIEGEGLNWRLFYSSRVDLSGQLDLSEDFSSERFGDAPGFGLWIPDSRWISTQLLTPPNDPHRVLTSLAFHPGAVASTGRTCVEGFVPKSFEANVALDLPIGALYRRCEISRSHPVLLPRSAWTFRIAMN